MNCSNCGYAIREGVRFCEGCGASLAPACSSCGAELPPGVRFCGQCGTPVEADPVASDGTLKVVSVVFADLVGSTALQEALDTESTRRVMARFYERMRSVVERHDGALEKFIGDAVVVVFGAPVLREDDALRAVRCGLAMAAELDELNDDLERAYGVRLQLRIGVNTGELVVNDEGILVGDTMNTAARFEQAAAAGEVLIGEATRRLVRHQAELQEIEPLNLKGKASPVRAWRVLSVASGPAARLDAPLVGRDLELARLRSVLGEAVATSSCRLVSVIGSPGLGKSRLAQEFATAVSAEATVLTGHCEPSGEGITFLPVADVLRGAAGIAEADPSDAVIEKLTALLSDDVDAPRIVARAASLLGAGEAASPEETFWSVRRLLEALARRRPVVIVLDDVHWAQPLFLDLVEHLVEWVRDAPMMLVALARPELREVREALTSAGRRASDVIELEPLDTSESRELVEGLLGRVDLPSALLDRILETTDGNPLFLGELLRMLVDEGAVVQAGDSWVAAGGAEAVQVPPTIQALLTARIERLRPHERTVVERASVIGKQFYRGAVAELVAPPVRSGIDGHLETLRRKDMVEPEGTYWIDEPVYRFHHVLIRDAAYHLLLKEARAELHEKFADWLGAKAGELVGEHEEVIAYHLEQALQYRRALGPLDERARGIGQRAAGLLWSAGRRALAREDLAAAANLLRRAHDCGADDAMLWDLGEALLSAGDTAAAAVAIEGLSGPRGVVLETQLAVLTGTGADLARVVAATSDLAANGDDVGVAKGHHVTAQVQAQLGQVADVEASLDRALLAARKAGDRRRITAVLAAAPRAALWGPSPVVRASGRCLDVVRILRMTPGNRHVEAVALRCQAVLEAMRGRAGAARDILAAGRTTLEELGLSLELHELAVHAGIVELLDGRPDAAEALLRTAREGFAALGVSVSAAQAAALLARALVDQGRDEEAIAETELAEQGAGRDLKTTITWCGVRAEALARRGGLEDAVELARRAVALAEPTDALADKADANTALAKVLVAAGCGDEARAVAAEAHRLYEEKDHLIGARRAEQLAGARADAATPSQTSVADVSDPAVADLLRRFDQAWRAHDYDRLLEIYPPGGAVVDHRQLGWGRLQGDRWADGVRSVLEMWDDVRVEIAEVIACGSGVIAARMKWLGHGAETGGEIEIDLGTVTVIREGRMASLDYYEPGDRDSMLARFEELTGTSPRLGGGTGAAATLNAREIMEVIPDPEIAAFYTRFAELWRARDAEELLACRDPEYELIDHRQLGWSGLPDLQALKDTVHAALAMSDDLSFAVDEVLACDRGVVAMKIAFRGHSSETGGELEIPMGCVVVFDDGRIRREELFEPDAESSMLACFADLKGRVLIAGTPIAHIQLPWIDRFGRHDAEGLRELIADEYTLVDHRSLGWEAQGSPDDFIAGAQSAWAMWPDFRVAIDEVLACDEHTMASRVTYHGTSVDSGGRIEVSLGYVTTYSDRQMVHAEMFEHDDVAGLLARYEELGGTVESSQLRSTERWLQEFQRRWNAHDQESVIELFDEDFALSDRRQIALWGEVRGREAQAAIHASSRARFDVDEVIACDDHVIASRIAWRGEHRGGEHSTDVGAVSVIRDGLHVSMDVYDPDDRAAMIARYAELGGGAQLLGDRPPERLVGEYVKRFAARDLGPLLELNDPAFAMVDHRSMGWEQMLGAGSPAQLQTLIWQGTADIRVEIDEVLACDETTIALTATFTGTASRETGGGPFLYSVGQVAVIERGRYVRVEWFEPDAREAMLTRYAALVERELPPLLWHIEFGRRYAARDLDGMLALYQPDAALDDHRSVALWEPNRGIDDFRRMFASVIELNERLGFRIEEVLACDERLFAAVVEYSGCHDGSDWEISAGLVTVVENGRAVRLDFYDPDDRETVLARFAESPGARRHPAAHPPERLFAEHVVRFNRHDIDASLELIADDFRYTDRRAISLGSTQGRDAHRETLRSIFEVAPDARTEVLEVIARDDRVLAVRARYHGHAVDGSGEFELLTAYVLLIQDGLWKSVDQYDPDDRQAILARYAELGGSLSSEAGALKPWERFDLLYNARRFDELHALYTGDYRMVDRRAMAWEEIEGGPALVATCRSFIELAPDLLSRCEVLAEAPGFCLLRNTFTGHGFATGASEAGPIELVFDEVGMVTDSQFVYTELFDPADDAPARARYEELVAGGPPGRRSEGRSVRMSDRVLTRYLKAYNDHDVEAAAACLAEDWELTDHHATGMWDDVQGQEAWAQQLQTVWNSRDGHDLRLELGETLAQDDRLGAWIVRLSGTDRRGGTYEVLMGWVMTFAGEQLSSLDMYEPDDRAAILVRFAELGGGQALLGDRPPERWWVDVLTAYARGDVEELVGLYSEDWTYTDHRQLGWEQMTGHTDLREFWRSAIAASSARYGEIEEVLAADDRVAAVRVTWHGFDAEHGGEFAIPVGNISVVEAGGNVRQEQYDPDDREAMLARFQALAARPIHEAERVLRRSVDANDHHDREGLAATYAEDIVMIDHRAVAWEPLEGRTAIVELAASGWETAPGTRCRVDEVLARDDEVIALRIMYDGAANADEGGGEFELPIGFVAVVREGLIRRIELFDPDDPQAMIARYADVGGGLGKLGDSVSERLFADYAKRYAARDLDGLLAQVAEEWVLDDHRIVGWEALPKDQYAAQMQTVWDSVSVIWIEVDEVLGADDRAIAAIYTYRGIAGAEAGSGPFEYVVGYVGANNDSHSVSSEFFDPNDREAILARFAELAASHP